jgi:dTDP-4-dehydrorhamnose reductase
MQEPTRSPEYEFANVIFGEAAKFGRSAPRVTPIATADYPSLALRPAYSVMSTSKIDRVFGIRPPL